MTRTLGRQVLLGYLAPLGATVLIVAVATLALGVGADRNDEVVQDQLAVVLDAHRLQEEVLDESLDVRTFLLTGQEQWLDRAEVHAREVERVLDRIDAATDDPQARSSLERIRADYAGYTAVTQQVVDLRRTGARDAELAGVVSDQLTGARDQFVSTVGDFVTSQELQAEAAAAEAARQTTVSLRLIWLLGLGAVVVAIVVAGWLTRSVSQRLSRLATSIGTAAEELLATTSQQVAGANEQASAVQQTVATTDELTQSAEEASRRANQVADDAQRSVEIAETGRAAVANAVDGMTSVQAQVEKIAAGILSLTDRAQAISKITDTVRDLADQTNVLALNASIEAARAGDEGRGFSVVAAEVRSLAEESQRATAEVATILGEIEQATQEAVISTEEGTKRVVDGAERIESAGTTIEELAGTIQDAAAAIEQIAASAGQQAGATAQIGEAMRDVHAVVDQGLAAARQSERTARTLSEVATDLRVLAGID